MQIKHNRTAATTTTNNNNSNSNDSSQHSNGKSPVGTTSPDMLGRVKKEELVRLILQSLNDLGYR